MPPYPPKLVSCCRLRRRRAVVRKKVHIFHLGQKGPHFSPLALQMFFSELPPCYYVLSLYVLYERWYDFNAAVSQKSAFVFTEIEHCKCLKILQIRDGSTNLQVFQGFKIMIYIGSSSTFLRHYFVKIFNFINEMWKIIHFMNICPFRKTLFSYSFIQCIKDGKQSRLAWDWYFWFKND